METAPVWLLLGGFFGIWLRGLRTATAKEQSERQIAALLHQVETMRQSEARRMENAARRQRYYEENDIADTQNQLKFISQCDLRPASPVNKAAVRILYALENWIVANQPKWRVSFEVSMGAFIKTASGSENRKAFSSYNSKRVDFLVIDNYGSPKIVIEYNGTGHDLSDDAEDRMDVKRLVLGKVGIPLVEIPTDTAQPEILRMLSEAFVSNTVR